VDAWIALAAIAAGTQHLRLGPVITPLARRRPSKIAREIVSLDQLSRGRVVFGVGLGTPPDADFGCFGEDPTRLIGFGRRNSTKL
jgi:alkanesulfonate monooxygenase SsuD/methylene tetrahydromethanopterin reductase-like flavin-dependent oxidoreductase (luciferase family)